MIPDQVSYALSGITSDNYRNYLTEFPYLQHGRSEHEWNLILEEWREHQRQHHEKRVTLNGKLLAEFLHKLEKDEAWQLQRLRDLEEQPQREALLMLGTRAVEEIQETEQAPIEVDLSTLPTYEVYH